MPPPGQRLAEVEEAEVHDAATPTEAPPATGRQRFRHGINHTFSALAVYNFRILWFGMLFTMAAFQINIVSRSWLAYSISGSGAVLGIVALARGIPQFLLAPYGGVAADRFDKRTLLIVAQLLMAILSATIAILVQTGLITIWQLVVIGFFQGVIFPFLMPTRTAYISELVDDGRLPNALALDSTGRNLNRVVAPTLAGFLIALSPAMAFWAVTGFFLLSAAMLLKLPKPTPKPFRSSGTFSDMLFGFRYIAARPNLVALMGLAFVFVLLGMPYSQLLPVFQQNVFHVGPEKLGFMYTAVGLGAVVGSLTAAYLAESTKKRTIQIVVGCIFGLMLAGFALSPSYVVGLPFLLIAGGMIETYFTLNRILVILNTDRAVFGRVMAIYSMSWSLTPVSLLVMGAIVDQVGAPLTVATAGIALAIVVVVLALSIPGVRRVGEMGH
ncbi:MAG TPA: MFS transporter [Thermomicrobiaceae bacterium]|nr:MFS transporter [Thermomicrobiaceae bacterium]